MKQKIKFDINSAGAADSGWIAEIEKQCFSSPWSENQIREETEKDNVIFIAAKSGDIGIGYVSGQLILDEFYISNIAVSEKYRNNGIASALLNELIKRLDTGNCTFTTLEVRESNLGARSLYEKFGFRLLGLRKDFYSAPKEDACIYTLYFNNESEASE